MSTESKRGQFQRLSETKRPQVTIHVDGEPVTALAGDTVMTALLLAGTRLREFEFAGDGGGARAGFCLMGACQDCWVDVEGGGSLRACTSYVREGLRLRTGGGEAESG
ncbi:MAG TPA: (2Fe-2S)-binding protein [Alphaproteobacteria bacterium]|nr:(2Fe-2S)-binding protein [Alphaproteobacteria bacterium]MDP7641756.1 (2Fe-2S)-binding protein [Alphaproteobacteria bacterium]HJN60901.1 (2Fe-2S)-binding protein [Alphaproteobacteria bacterium]